MSTTAADPLAGQALPAAVEAPSSGTSSEETSNVSVQDRINSATSEEYKTWREKGDIPAVKPPKAAAPGGASKSAAQEPTQPSEDKTAKGAPAATPAAPTQKTESRTERNARRWNEHKERTASAERRAADLQREVEELKRSRSAAPTAAASDSQAKPEAAAPAKPATEAAFKPTRPKPTVSDKDPATSQSKYTSYDAFLDDLGEWNQEQAVAKIDARLAKERETQTQTERQRQQEQQNVELGKKFVAAREKYSDFDAVIGNEKLLIPLGCPADRFVRRSENPGEILYYLGKHPEILESFYEERPDGKGGVAFWDRMDPIDQFARLTEIAHEIKASASTAARVAEKAPSAAPLPPRLPAPPTELSGRRSAAVDDAEAALARGDTAAYMRIKNAQDSKAGRR